MNHPRAIVVSAAALVAAVLMGSCSNSPTEIGNELAVDMGNASPASSPRSEDPHGRVYDYDPVLDLDETDGLIAVRTDASVTIGSLDQVTAGNATTYQLAQNCGAISANAGSFVAGCGDEIRIFTAEGEQRIATSRPVTVATRTTTGEVLAGSDEARTVWLYRDGELAEEIAVARETDQIQAVPVAGRRDAVVRTNSFDTTIQDLDWAAGRQGGTLRIGLGVGKVAAGEDGLVLAADATGSQLLIYTTDNIIRLHQMAPVAHGPWDVAWDSAARLAWVASTAGNVATGYDISRGVPLERASIHTVADPQSIVALDDGTVLIASASGDGLQVVSPADKTLHDLPQEA